MLLFPAGDAYQEVRKTFNGKNKQNCHGRDGKIAFTGERRATTAPVASYKIIKVLSKTTPAESVLSWEKAKIFYCGTILSVT